MNSALSYARQNGERFLAELREVLRIPSISTDPDRKGDMQQAAEWMSSQLRSVGMVKRADHAHGGHPVVYGEWLEAARGAPTVMIYGHYDVQPPEPLELWPARRSSRRSEGTISSAVALRT